MNIKIIEQSDSRKVVILMILNPERRVRGIVISEKTGIWKEKFNFIKVKHPEGKLVILYGRTIRVNNGKIFRPQFERLTEELAETKIWYRREEINKYVEDIEYYEKNYSIEDGGKVE